MLRPIRISSIEMTALRQPRCFLAAVAWFNQSRASSGVGMGSVTPAGGILTQGLAPRANKQDEVRQSSCSFFGNHEFNMKCT